MSAIMVGVVSLVVLMILIFAGVHIISALMVMSVVGIFLVSDGNLGTAINILGTTAYGAMRDYTFGVIPLFVLMGLFASLSGASKDLFDAADATLRRVKGGLSIATVAANAVFAAITGVSVASAAVFTKIALPPMQRLGYDRKFAVGTIAGSSVLGMLIPPSTLMIIYGMLAEVAIGSMFVAGVVPGIVLAVIYCIGISVLVRMKPELISKERAAGTDDLSGKERWKVILRPWPMFLLIIVTLGGIWGGFFTPTEAGGIGAFGAFLMALCKRKITWKSLWNTLLEAGMTTGSIIMLMIAGSMYSKMLAMTGVITKLGKLIIGSGLSDMLIMALFMVIIIALGCILDSTSIMLLCMPLMVPVVRAFGLDPVWFGIVAIVATEMGFITPPFGLCVFTVKASLEKGSGLEDMTVGDIFHGSFPFLIMMFLFLILIIAFPQIVLCLL